MGPSKSITGHMGSRGTPSTACLRRFFLLLEVVLVELVLLAPFFPSP